jgi:serine/threonine protein kinase
MRVPDPEFYDIALKEFHLIKNLEGNSNIIKVFDIFYNRIQEKIYMLMEYSGEGTDINKFLKNLNKSEDEQHLSEEDIKIIARNIFLGLKYLHKRGICHRDIKPSNIFLS